MAEDNKEKKGILLETGTNEFEIVEFNIGDVNYGINVAKVREVITAAAFPVTSMPTSTIEKLLRLAWPKLAISSETSCERAGVAHVI